MSKSRKIMRIMLPESPLRTGSSLNLDALFSGKPAPRKDPDRPLKTTKFDKHFRIQFHGSVLIAAICAQVHTKHRSVQQNLDRIEARSKNIREKAMGQKVALLTEKDTRRMNRAGNAIAKIVKNQLSDDDILEHLGAATDLCKLIRDQMKGPVKLEWTYLYQSFVTLFTNCENEFEDGYHRFVIGGDPVIEKRNEAIRGLSVNFFKAVKG